MLANGFCGPVFIAQKYETHVVILPLQILLLNSPAWEEISTLDVPLHRVSHKETARGGRSRMQLAGIELRYIVNDLKARTAGYYVSNIYGISREGLLFKLHHPEKPDVMLAFSTYGLWPSSVRIRQIEENRLLRRLRGDLLRLKLDRVEQPGTERVVRLGFRGFEREYILIGEFFGDGNVILCNGEMKILALLHSLDVKHRSLHVGQQYEPPPGNNLDVLTVAADDLEASRLRGLATDRWLGRTLGLPSRYVEAIIRDAGLDAKTDSSDLSRATLDALSESLGRIAGSVVNGDHDPVIVHNGGEAQVHPVQLLPPGPGTESVPSFIEGLDKIFTGRILESGRQLQSHPTEKKIAELESQIAERERAIETVRARSSGISGLASSMMSLARSGAGSLRDRDAIELVRSSGSEMITERGVPKIVIRETKIRVDPDASLYATASALFDEAKKQSGAAPAIEKLIRKTRKEMADLQTRSQDQRNSVSFSKVRKKEWYERYRWFFTSDGNLAIGGRDASSNSSIVRKHMEKGDRVFHAEIYGSPFFILKGGADAGHTSLLETAHATVCFSRAWRESMHGLSSYWVEPDQVKRSAPSGQFLPRGSFTIEGRRNFLRVSSLKLAVGAAMRSGEYVLTCGPPETIKAQTLVYALIEPSGMELADLAKKVRSEFVATHREISKIPVDEFIRVLPAGKGRVTKTGEGDLAGA